MGNSSLEPLCNNLIRFSNALATESFSSTVRLISVSPFSLAPFLLLMVNAPFT